MSVPTPDRSRLILEVMRRLAELQALLASEGVLILPGELPVPPGTNASPAGGRRRGTVLDVLQRAEKPLKGRALAARASARYDGHFRELMGELVREGLVIHAPQGGYWPKGRALPGGGG